MMKRKLPIMILALLLSFLTKAQSVVLQSATGWLETATVKWQPVSGAQSYNVYYTGGGVTNKKIDAPLIRSYGSYLRADIPGLKAGSYTVKVAPVISGTEGSGTTSSSINVLAHDRTGFAFNGGRVPGAYKADGTPKDGAVILYITENTKNTVSLDVTGATVNPCVGLQMIFDGFKKGKDTRPLIIRLIGQVTDASNMQAGDYVIENSNNASSYITMEGIGEDATADGWGIRIKNASNVEVRNIGTMNCNSSEGDNIGLQQGNDYIWVHHCDFFYGDAGSDADQIKGDGALDCKKSTYVTFSYNHFFDSGKSNLLGLSEGTTTGLYITYHHNWYDHSDSRHPRVRFYSAHVYNNYYDGNAKYGIGSTEGSSVFSEGNYYRNCKYPMLTSMQGSDVYNESTGTNDYKNMATFSSEDGGTIKAFNNYMEDQHRFVAYGASGYPNSTVDFDAYVVTSKSQTVPSSVKSAYGANTYNNFDNSSAMYSYTAQSPEAAKAAVMQYAGRMNGGDFKWTFDNAVDDASSSVNTALKSALVNYKTSLKTVQGEGTIIVTPPAATYTLTAGTSGSGTVSGAGTYNAGTNASLTATAASGWTFSNWSGAASGSSNPVSVTMDADKSVTAVFTQNGTTPPVDPGNTGNQDHNFTTSGTSSSFYSISGNLSTSKGTVTYAGLTLTQCLKMESATSISFTTTQAGDLTLVFNSDFNSGVYIDGNSVNAASGIATATLAVGSHTITKDAAANLFYIGLAYAGGGTVNYTLSTTIVGQGSVNPSSGTYASGTSVSMTATPASGWQFDSWSGGSTSNPATVVMNANKSITANFSQIPTTNYTLTTVVNGQGSISPNGGSFAAGTSVSVTATPASGWKFDSWSGGSTANPATVTMNANKSITANFSQIVNTVTATIQENTTGFCAVNGSVDSNNAGFTGAGFANTDNVLGSGVDYKINASAGSATLLVQYASTSDRPANIIVNGVVVKSLSMPSTGAWTTWTSVSTSITLASGANTIRLEATTASGLGNIDYITVTGVGVSATSCTTVTNYTVATSTIGSGTVSGAGTYIAGSSAALTATPASGWQFSGWSGGVSGTTNPLTVTVNSNLSVTATFTQIPVTYTLTTTIVGQGTVSPANGTYPAGTSVTLTATPASGWKFDNWSGGYTGTSATVVMDGNKAITANFSLIPVNVTLTIQESTTGFCGVEGTVDSNNAGFTGAGFANTANAVGAGIDYSISTSGGTATVVIQYANGSTDRPTKIIVNGSQQVASLSLPSTGGWTTWASVSTTVALTSGTNTIRLEATTSGGLPNVDYLKVTAFDAAVVSCNSGARESSITSTGVEINATAIQVYPNPVVNMLTISAGSEIQRIDIYSLTGVLVNTVTSQFNAIDVSHLRSGHYLIQVLTEEGKSVHRVFKDK
jgi:pectate lyase